jgi:hypothetical protein
MRGLSDAARTIRRLGAEEEAARIEAEVEAYRRDLLASIEASSVETSPVDADPEVYVPPGPTQTEPIARLTQDRHASYCNYRYFPEMISASVLPARVVRRVLDWRLAHGGEMLAMTRFDRPPRRLAGAQRRAGAARDRRDRALSSFCSHAHLAHHHAAGWLDGPEQVKIFPDESGCPPLPRRAGRPVPGGRAADAALGAGV